MPVIIKILILAVLQGLTEFLPVSSSGHLVLGKSLLGLRAEGVFLEVILHAGTLLAILVFYRKRLSLLLKQLFSGEGDGRYYIFQVVLATIPAVVGYILLDDWIEESFSSPQVAAGLMAVTGLVLLSLLLRRKCTGDITVGRSLAIGFAQALAMFPGLSRSGLTIVLGRHLGLSPERAAEFSFLMAIPALGGAALIKGIEAIHSDLGDATAIGLLLGAAVAGLVGYGAIVILVKTLRAGRFWMFGFYCLAAAALGWFLG